MTLETPSSLLDRLRSLPAGERQPVKIEQLDTLPAPPPAEDVKAKVDDSLAPLIDQIYDFLTSPIVEDHFGSDDQARDAWEAEVFKLLG